MPVQLDAERAIAARLIVLTLIADGELANREIDALDRHGIAELIGVDRDVLMQSVAELCGDLLAEDAAEDTVRIADVDRIHAMLDAITDPELQKLTCRAMLVLAKADGSIALPEQTLLRQALTHWGLSLDAVAGKA